MCPLMLIFEMNAYTRHREQNSALTDEWTQRSQQGWTAHVS